MLTLPVRLYDAVIAHALAAHPEEACGLLTGPAGAGRPERFVPMINAIRHTRQFRFDPAQQLAIWRDMDAHNENPVVLYHSHTTAGAYPSAEDVEHALLPGAHYLIVSTRDYMAGLDATVDAKSFVRLDDQLIPEPIDVLRGAPL
ncbi:Mov34/MPN/PAD-1 family protein [Nocardiopsis terrae]|uniref:Mov34/MPN/PAD-1 family protein n=1 Tax=Streptomyces sp. NPDC057554 TaxID=3350538 RepID=UPI003682A67E